MPSFDDDKPLDGVHAPLIEEVDEEASDTAHEIIPLSKSEALAHILKTVGPFTLTNLVSAGYTIGNGFILASLGPNAVAAGPYMSTVAYSVFSISRGVLNATGNIIGESNGKLKASPGNEAIIGVQSRQSYVVAVGLGGLALCVFLNTDKFLLGSGVDTAVATTAQSYFTGISYGLFPMLLNYSDQQMLLGLSHQKPVLIAGIAYPLLAALFGYPLALGAFNLPDCGTAGIGYGASLSGLLCFVGLRLYLRGEAYRQYYLYGMQGLRDIGGYWSYLKIGVPTGLLNLGEWGNFFGISEFTAKFGQLALEAMQGAIIPTSAYTALLLGLAQATGVSISNCLGEGKEALKLAAKEALKLTDRENAIIAKKIAMLREAARVAQKNAKLLGYMALALGVILSVAVALLFILGAKPIAEVFIGSADNNVLDMAIRLLIINGVGLLFDTIRNILGGALRGYGDVRFMPLVSIVVMSAGLLVSGFVTSSMDRGSDWLFITRDLSVFLAGAMVTQRYLAKSSAEIEVVAVTTPGQQRSCCARIGFFAQGSRTVLTDDRRPVVGSINNASELTEVLVSKAGR